MPRDLPHSDEAEQAVISAISVDHHSMSIAGDLLKPDDFYDHRHKVLFEAMTDIYNRGQEPDLVILCDHLKAAGKLDQVGGPVAISDLCGCVTSTYNLRRWIDIVRDKATLRSTIEACRNVATQAMENPEDVEAFCNEAQAAIFNACDKSTGNEFVSLRQLSDSLVDSVRELNAKEKGLYLKMPSFDNLFHGLHPGQLVIIGARPKVGKSALALQIATKVAATGRNVLFISMEMSAKELAWRALTSISGLSRGDLKYRASDDLVDRMKKAATALSVLPLTIDEQFAITAEGIRARARRHKVEKGLDLVIVDYAQLITPRDHRMIREQQVGESARVMKVMGGELGVPVILLSQLNRSPSKDDREPRMSDLRDSGQLEQHADIVALLHDKGGDVVQVDVAAHRNGPTGKFEIYFDKRVFRFHDDAAPGHGHA